MLTHPGLSRLGENCYYVSSDVRSKDQCRDGMLAIGSGWNARDVVCAAGPKDRPFTEVEQAVCVAAVTSGTFTYRSSRGSVLLAPGCLLLSNAGSEFECRHEHSIGDRCIAFHFEPALFQTIASAAQIEWSAFGVHRIRPVSSLVPLITEIALSTDRPDPLQMEELAMRLASCALLLSTGETPTKITPTWDDEARVTVAIRFMEQHFDEHLTLQQLSSLAGLSQFHFLRIFRKILGITPYQFLIRIRLRAAAKQLRCSNELVTDISTACGFGDLSQFTRYFKSSFGASPSQYRRYADGARSSR
jgi:AraC family transcriptional regulator